MPLKSIFLLFLHGVTSSAAPALVDGRRLQTNQIVMAAKTKDPTGFCFELSPKPSNMTVLVTCSSSEADVAPCCNGGKPWKFKPSTNKKCGSLANMTSAVTVTCSAAGYTDGMLEIDPTLEVEQTPDEVAEVASSTESIIKVTIDDENPRGFCFDLDPKPLNTTTVTCNGKMFNFKDRTKNKCGKINADPIDSITVTCWAIGYSEGTLEVGPLAAQQEEPNAFNEISATPDNENTPPSSTNGTNVTLGTTEIETQSPPSPENRVEMSMNDRSSFCVVLRPEPPIETNVTCSSSLGNDWHFKEPNENNCGSLPTNVVGKVTVACTATDYEDASLVVVGADTTETIASNNRTVVDDANGTRFSMPDAVDVQMNKTGNVSTSGQTNNEASYLGQDVIATSSNVTKSIVMTMNFEKSTGADFCFHLNPKPSAVTTVNCFSDSASAHWRSSGNSSWEFDPSMDILCNRFTPNRVEHVTLTCSAMGYVDGILEVEPANTAGGIIVVTDPTATGLHFCFDLEPKPLKDTLVACTTSPGSASCCKDGREWVFESSMASQCGTLESDPLENVTVTCSAVGYANGTGVIDPASFTTDGIISGSVEKLSSGAIAPLKRITLRNFAAISVLTAVFFV